MCLKVKNYVSFKNNYFTNQDLTNKEQWINNKYSDSNRWINNFFESHIYNIKKTVETTLKYIKITL